jgi:glycine dehydrogenase subunit 2
MTTAHHQSHHSHQSKRALIFERSQTGRIGYRLPALDVDEVAARRLSRGVSSRRRSRRRAGSSEVDVIRHFVRMSTWNYSIDLGMYPLGSCTMKYNSRLNEKVARIAGFANLHPLN